MGEELVEGAVVRWTGGEGVGVIRRIASGLVEVEWDSPSEQTPTTFAAKNAPLVRAVLRSQVRRRSTDQPAILGATGERRPSEVEGHRARSQRVLLAALRTTASAASSSRASAASSASARS